MISGEVVVVVIDGGEGGKKVMRRGVREGRGEHMCAPSTSHAVAVKLYSPAD